MTQDSLPRAISRLPDADPPETYADLGREYPLALIAGGLALGIVAGALLPRGFGRGIARGGAAIIAFGAEVGRRVNLAEPTVSQTTPSTLRSSALTRLAQAVARFASQLQH